MNDFPPYQGLRACMPRFNRAKWSAPTFIYVYIDALIPRAWLWIGPNRQLYSVTARLKYPTHVSGLSLYKPPSSLLIFTAWEWSALLQPPCQAGIILQELKRCFLTLKRSEMRWKSEWEAAPVAPKSCSPQTGIQLWFTAAVWAACAPTAAAENTRAAASSFCRRSPSTPWLGFPCGRPSEGRAGGNGLRDAKPRFFSQSVEVCGLSPQKPCRAKPILQLRA